ncbi:MAG: glycosyltransferase family 4 protein [Streptosporangiaceae bacterium]
MTGLAAAGRSGDAAPLRVALVLGAASGGTARHVAMLAAGCARRGMAVTVIGPESTRALVTPPPASAGPVPAGPVPAGAVPAAFRTVAFEPAAILDRPRPGPDVVTVLRLRRLLRLARPDVVHAHGVRAGAFAAAALAGSRARRPALVVTVHNAPPPARWPALAYRVLERACARRADVLLCVSADLARRMRALGGRRVGDAVIAAPAVRPPDAAALAGARDAIDAAGRPVVLSAGRLAPQKGQDILLAAAARWQHRPARPVLVIAGDGPLAADLGRLSVAGHVDVRFLGPRTDVPALLAMADVVVVASRWEGQPLLVQEALRAGRPLVATRVGGIPALTGANGALLVPPGDPAGLAAAVLAVLDDPGLASDLAASAAAAGARLPDEGEAVAAAASVYASAAAARGRCNDQGTARRAAEQ